MAEKNEGEWIPWKGAPCPVEPNTEVEVRFRDGSTRQHDAGTFALEPDWWQHELSPMAGHRRDIIAYRIV